MKALKAQIDSVRLANTIIYALTLLGGIITLFTSSRTCISDCEYSFATYIPNPSMISFTIAAMLFSTLGFLVVNLFTSHVEMSHKNAS